MDKQRFLEQVVRIAAEKGHTVELANIGERMYDEAPDIATGRILDLPRQRLVSLRRSVFKDVIRIAQSGANLLVNTHATFRWKHGLFHAYDHVQIAELDPNFFVTLVDNVDAVHERLIRDHEIRHTLKDILVWREEEIVVTEAMAEAVAGYGHAYVLSRSHAAINATALYRLMFEPKRKRAYPSFPMTHVLDQPAIMREIEHFRNLLAQHFITFDPADLNEKRLLFEAGEAAKRNEDMVTVKANNRTVDLNVREVMGIARDIDAQIYARDFKLIDQADMIVSYIPSMPDGRPAISSGVERELQHAFEGTREVYVIWRPDAEPSPFVTETATAVFRSVDEFFAHCQSVGYIREYQMDLP